MSIYLISAVHDLPPRSVQQLYEHAETWWVRETRAEDEIKTKINK